MRKRVGTMLLLGLAGLGGVLLAAPAARADTGGQGQPAAAAAEVLTATGTIEGINRTTRMVTLRDEQGMSHAVKAPESVDLSRLKEGQRVGLSYQESVAIGLGKPGEKPSLKERMTASRMSKSVSAGRQITEVAQIIAVDPQKNMLTVKGPKGEQHKVHVTDNDLQQRLSKLKTGDTIRITYSEAVAISILPQEQPGQQGQPGQPGQPAQPSPQNPQNP